LWDFTLLKLLFKKKKEREQAMNDEWKDLLWLIGFLIWLFGTPVVAMYILWKWQTLDSAIIATIILLPPAIFLYLHPKCGGKSHE